MPAIHVTALYRYPVKGCRASMLDSADVVPRGIAGDRGYMLVDDSGCFITQRTHPRMALIVPQLVDDSLLLTAPDREPLYVPRPDDGKRHRVTIWSDDCDAVDQGDAVARWLSGFLGESCRLVRMVEDYVRLVDRDYAVSESDEVGFADGYPFLLTTEESLAELNRRMDAPLPMNRFRPSIVLSGAEPFAEDGWRTIRVGAITFSVVKPCARCVVTTTDQFTAERGKEPLTTLATFRKVRGKGVMFGQNLIHHSSGTLRVGDAVELIE